MRYAVPGNRKLTDQEQAELVEITLVGVPTATMLKTEMCQRVSSTLPLTCTRTKGHGGWHAGHGHDKPMPLGVWLDE